MTNPTVTELIGRSNRLGSDPKNTNYAGGNTSAKASAIDPVTGSGPVGLFDPEASGLWCVTSPDSVTHPTWRSCATTWSPHTSMNRR